MTNCVVSGLGSNLLYGDMVEYHKRKHTQNTVAGCLFVEIELQRHIMAIERFFVCAKKRGD